MQTVRMHDRGAVYDINIDASEQEVEELETLFDSGNSSLFEFTKLIINKGYNYEVLQVGGTRRNETFG